MVGHSVADVRGSARVWVALHKTVAYEVLSAVGLANAAVGVIPAA